jgi:hypothetical protein
MEQVYSVESDTPDEVGEIPKSNRLTTLSLFEIHALVHAEA